MLFQIGLFYTILSKLIEAATCKTKHKQSEVEGDGDSEDETFILLN